MPFRSLTPYNFRNLVDNEVRFDSERVFFVGENGQGKSNILEAIYLCCYGKSFRLSTDLPMIRHDSSEMSVRASFYSSESPQSPRKVQVILRSGRKEILLDDRPIADRKDLISQIPCIVFCHEDFAFVRGAPEEQRTFFDQSGSLIYPAYLSELRDYGKVLRSRNRVLKEGGFELLDVYDTQLRRLGLAMMERRETLAGLFNQGFANLYREISGDEGDLFIEYRPNWKSRDPEEIARVMEGRRKLDMTLKTTSSGPHRDKFVFLREGIDMSQTASTGQVRLLSLLLRLYQARLVHEFTQKAPILLLDDVLLELDLEKRVRFLDKLPVSEQAFFTFLPDEQLQHHWTGSSTRFRVEKGSFHEEGG